MPLLALPTFLGNVKDTFTLVDQNALTEQFQERSKQLQRQVISDALSFQMAQLDESIPYYETMFRGYELLATEDLKASVNSLYSRYGQGTSLTASVPRQCLEVLRAGIERFMQDQTFKQFSADQKHEAKLQKQNEQDTHMGEASTSTTRKLLKQLFTKP
ncbi:uncharacterized protein V1513DRAFT_427836 [Lipomyces chichibuensis]|uniref:uncharacterized protein n=1 Tax=Lipomyces chichibuensis TaxID=1546026 RepID=UPI003343B4F0